jgi:Protein of unknown function (DUF3500)
MDAITSRNLRPALGAATHFVDPATFPEPARTVVQNALGRAQNALASEFKGITADGNAAPGLFSIVKTGISVQPIIDAVNAFVALLTDEQRQKLNFSIDSTQWRSWHNMHCFLLRHGLLLADLSEPQRDAALNILRASLSASGYENARDVMMLNEHAAEITGRFDEFNEWFYWISLFGEPPPSEPSSGKLLSDKPLSDKPWGWQIDGHHLIINCFILGDQLVMTPDFRGSEPVLAKSGKYEGTRVFDEEEALGLALMKALSSDQQRAAIIGSTIPRDVITTAQVDNIELEFSGIRYDALTAAQRELLRKLIALYVDRIRPGHASVRMAEVLKHLSQTYFGWIGECDETSPFYYRIYSPVILIEFDHLPGIIWDNMEPTRDHIHTVVRTPNGNDYGRDLLRQHYQQHDHSHPDTAHRRGLV